MWSQWSQPRSGPVYDRYRKDKLAYRNGIRIRQRDEKLFYTNDLHEALLRKQGKVFWNCWRSKFKSSKGTVKHVDGVTDIEVIAEHFASHFSNVSSNSTTQGAARLKDTYEQMRAGYRGSVVESCYRFDAELVESVITELKRGKAAGLDGLTSEHLQHSHSLLPVVLAKLFNLMMQSGRVPPQFGQSYTVPIIKNNYNVYNKSVTVDDFRGISISPVVSKVFEHCILDRYEKFFITSDNQFGFKKKSGCTHALYTLRCAVSYYNKLGSTVNLCALDVSKAFDKMNHYGLFIKLMYRRVPVNLLQILENWFMISFTCVKWGSVLSRSYQLICGIRQGGVLSPHLFALYIDSVVDRVRASGVGCYYKMLCLSILLYADDILLLAPSIIALQQLVKVCECELSWLDMSVNVRKSACMRIGPRFNVNCSSIVTNDGQQLSWCENIRYLGVYLKAARQYGCVFSQAKRSYYRAFNAVYGKVGSLASEEVIVQLMKTKCLPVLYYALEVCPLNKSDIKALDYVLFSSFCKIFRTKSKDVVDDCMLLFGCSSVLTAVNKRKVKFLLNYMESSNSLCGLFSDMADTDLKELQCSINTRTG